MSAGAGGSTAVTVFLYLPYVTEGVGAQVAAVREGLRGVSHEILILDDGTGKGREWLRDIPSGEGKTKVVRLSKRFGETAAIEAALPYSSGEVFLTLPGSLPVSAKEVRALYGRIVDGEADMVLGARSGEPGGGRERLPLRVYKRLIRSATGASFRDFTSGVRAYRREVAEEIALYGEMIRFLPFLAVGRGYRVGEIPLEGCWPSGNGGRASRPTVYFNRMMDVLTLYFLLRFTQKPLRFFGLVGSVLLVPGLAINLYLFIDRVILLHGIAGRPLLLLGILLDLADEFGLRRMRLSRPLRPFAGPKPALLWLLALPARRRAARRNHVPHPASGGGHAPFRASDQPRRHDPL